MPLKEKILELKLKGLNQSEIVKKLGCAKGPTDFGNIDFGGCYGSGPARLALSRTKHSTPQKIRAP